MACSGASSGGAAACGTRRDGDGQADGNAAPAEHTSWPAAPEFKSPRVTNYLAMSRAVMVLGPMPRL
jgi:hypothetical protein